MHSDTFTERARFAYQYATPLVQSAIDGLCDARAAAAFGAAAVLPAGQNTDVAFPQVGEIPAARPTPVGGQLPPQAPGRGPATVTKYPGHDAPAFAFDGQPVPHVVLPGIHRCTHLVQFQRRPPFLSPLLGPQARPAGSDRQGFFLAARQSCAARRRLSAQCGAASCARPAAGLPARTAPLWRWREQTRPDIGRPCTGNEHDLGDGHFAESGHCRICRRVVCKP